MRSDKTNQEPTVSDGASVGLGLQKESALPDSKLRHTALGLDVLIYQLNRERRDMFAEAVFMPNWGRSKKHRLGKQQRRNRDRFVHIVGYGWFVYTRDELMIQAGIEVQGGLQGPFASRAAAAGHLAEIIASKGMLRNRQTRPVESASRRTRSTRI